MIIDSWDASAWNFVARSRQLKALRASVPEKPENFNEKVRFRMAFDKRPILRLFADKYHVRDYVIDLVGSEYLADIFDVAGKAGSIEWSKLPKNFVCKTNHGSGGLVGVWTGVEQEAKLPDDLRHLGWTRWWVHPDNFDSRTCELMMDKWLHENYAFRKHTFPEQAYSSIKRKVYVEELLTNSNGTIASPYYFYIFDGVTKAVLVTSRDIKSTRFKCFVDRDWKELDVDIVGINSGSKMVPFPEAPENFNRMVEVAESLSNKIDFARVDLYNVDGRIVFSEITNYPGGGQQPWTPGKFEYQMGQNWTQDVTSKRNIVT